MSHICREKDLYGNFAESFWLEDNDRSPTQLFHYCPTQSAINIAQSGKMWASAFECMNDKHEFRYGLDIALNAIEESILKLPITSKELIVNRWKVFLNNEKTRPALRPYTLSFSDIPNNEHLWEHYGDNHQGVLIGINNSIGKRRILNGCFVKMHYDESIAKSILRERLARLESLFDCCDSCIHQNLTFLFLSYLQTVFLMSISLKHEIWSPEQEWRLVFFGYPQHSPNSPYGDIKIRSRESKLVDYLEIDLCKAGLKLNSLTDGKNFEKSSQNTLQILRNKILI